MKKAISLLLAVCLLSGGLMPAVSANNGANASLLQIYGDGMLFAANKPVRLAGTASPGAAIRMEISQGAGPEIRTGTSTALPDGSFEVECQGLPAGYTQYTIKAYANGARFAVINDVVFGALWLASGQSNMQYPLFATYEGFAISKTGGTDGFIRVLDVPAYPEYNGSPDNFPVDPLRDIKGAYWYKGSETHKLLGVSAVAYFFAEQLRAQLDIPVGILNASLGGSSIYTWLSREDIDSEPAVRDYLAETGRYITREQWDNVNHNVYADMTVNYNKKIEPLGVFEPDGLIWYQGESNISERYGAYTNAFNLMQKSYSAHFGYEGSQMPFVFTQLASYNYGKRADDFTKVGNFNIQLGEIQAQSPGTRATTTIYDVSLDWDTNKIDPSVGYVGPIHPMVKKPVGVKMAFAALGLVYGKRESYSAPLVTQSVIQGNRILVKFNNVGDGLVVKPYGFTGPIIDYWEIPLYGFSIAGKNGVYVEAKAEITAPDTVAIWSDEVKNPVSAAYAYSQVNNYSNLFATENGEFTLGVCAFVTKRLENAKYLQDRYWTTCELPEIWRAIDEPEFFPSFSADSDQTRLSYSSEEKAEGCASLKVDYSLTGWNKCFSFGPLLTYKENRLNTSFPALNTDYSVISAVSFKVKNTSGRPVTLKEMRFYTTPLSWFTPFTAEGDTTEVVIPADNEWHTVTLDLNNLCLFGIENGFKAGADFLEKVTEIKLMFADSTGAKGDNGTIYVDDFRFAPLETNPDYHIMFNLIRGILLLLGTVGKIFKLS